MLYAALSLACIAAAPQETAAPREHDLQALLAGAVDRPTERARASAVRELARLRVVTLDDWLAACATFEPLGADADRRRGTFTEAIELLLDGKPVAGEVAVHVPAGLDLASPAPLLVAMHGTGGRGEHMLGMWRRLADEHGLLLLCPSEPLRNEGFAATEVEREAVEQAIRWMRRRYDVDEDAVFLTGFSRGGHLTWDLGTRRPDRWAALAPMAGAPRFELARGANNMRYVENLLAVPVHDLQGALDQEGLVWSVREAFRLLGEYGAERARLYEHADLGHSVDMDVVDWRAFFASRRDPCPRRVVRRYARRGEGRANWLECLSASKEVGEVFQPRVEKSDLRELDQVGMRRLLVEQSLRHTGRVDAAWTARGRILVAAELVTRVRILLTREMLPEDGGKVEVRSNGRVMRISAEPSAEVLLSEFVERFDRRFLPVASIEVSSR